MGVGLLFVVELFFVELFFVELSFDRLRIRNFVCCLFVVLPRINGLEGFFFE
jgi:hypothetical protein